MGMEYVFGLALGTNTLALLGLAFRAGRALTKLEQAEKRIADLEASKTDIALARVGEQVNGVKAEVEQMRDEFRAWRLMWSTKAAAASSGG